MIPHPLQGRLRLPAIASPLFLISGPDMVVETCRAGMVGSFPSFNQRTTAGYEDWLKDIRSRVGDDDAPWAAQFAIHPTNQRLEADLAATIRYRVPILITALGITADVVAAIHSYGGLVFHDAVNLRHAQRALDAGVDGIIAVCGGAGGHAGTYNPFAFIGELKPLLKGRTLILSGCMVDGSSIAGAIAAGADMAYVGSRFINTTESLASERMKTMVLEATIDDIVYSAEVDGIGANWLRQTLPGQDLRAGGKVGTMNVTDVLGEPKRWRDILSAGQGVGSISDIPSTRVLVERMRREFIASAQQLAERAGVFAAAGVTSCPSIPPRVPA